jgi:glycosyltransferase involved in cell wall biosynthesis
MSDVNLLYSNGEEREAAKRFFLDRQLDMNKKSIVFSTPSETGTSYWRLFLPMCALYKKYPDKYNLLYTEAMTPNHVRLADLWVQHRAGAENEHFTKVIQMWPKDLKKPIIIHDVDDNEYDLPKRHPMRDMWYAAGKDKMALYQIKTVDYVTTTGSRLQQEFNKVRNHDKKVKVFRNQMDFDLPQWQIKKSNPFAEDKDVSNRIVVGWVGLTSHFQDLVKLKPIMKIIHDKYEHVDFIIAGMALKDTYVEVTDNPDGTKNIKEEEVKDEKRKYRYRVERLFSDLSKDRIKFYDAKPLENYAEFYTWLDISLAYVEHNTFNACKSEIKVVEPGYFGVPSVFTKWGGYEDMWNNMPTDLKKPHLAINHEYAKPWVEALSYWIENPKERIAYGKKFSKWIKQEYDVNRNIDERVEFYDELLGI